MHATHHCMPVTQLCPMSEGLFGVARTILKPLSPLHRFAPLLSPRPALVATPPPHPTGKYGTSASLSVPTCSGPCTAGFYCPPASRTSTTAQCGNVTVYCPEGSGSPVPVPLGWFTAPVSTGEATRYLAGQCAPGQYCDLGVARYCGPGRYSAAFGQALCDPCPAGARW